MDIRTHQLSPLRLPRVTFAPFGAIEANISIKSFEAMKHSH